MDDKTFVEEEQYYIHNWYSFLADIGGYMGLLLGCSLLSLYDEAVGLLKYLKQKLNGCRPRSEAIGQEIEGK